MVLLLLACFASAQTSSSISGTVKDRAGAVVAGAKVVLTNEANKATRSAKSNGDGFFLFASVQPATYSVDISYSGFETWTVTGITIHPGDELSIPKISLQVGAVTESVTVTAEVAGVSLNSGEHSTLITSDQIKRLSTVGRDANELISMLPGFAMVQSGIENTASSFQTMGFGSGNLSGFVANGAAPQGGSVNINSDGANLIDPGDMGGQISNVNMDQVQEIKIQTSNFGADGAKGPVVISAVGKSGGSEYHGSLYTHLRNYAFNSNDWISKKDGLARPQAKYFYPGGTIGGPVLIPGTHFNHSKRLVFWAGYEYYGQHTYNGVATAFVPTPAMLAGDLSTDSIASALNVTDTGLLTGCKDINDVTEAYLNVAGICATPSGYDAAGNAINAGTDLTKNGHLDPKSFDPGTATYIGFYPAINHTPQPVPGANGTGSASEGFNYAENNITTSNGFQFHSRVDENISDTLKLYVTYNWEKVNSTQNLSSAFDYNVAATNPLPTLFDSHSTAQYLTLNLVKTLGASLTNEVNLSGVLFKQPAQYEDRSKVLDSGTAWATAGYSGGVTPSLLYGAGTTKGKIQQNQLPEIGGWESVNVPSFAEAYVPKQGQYMNKYSWNATDNLTKMYKTHSLKAGVYVEQTANNGIDLGSNMNGRAEFMRWGSCHINELIGHPITDAKGNPVTVGTGNEVGQFLSGCPLNFTQDTSDPSFNLRFTTIEGYVNDEWKVNSKLTVTAGIRLSHIGPWTDRHGIGFAVWDPSELTPHVPFSISSDPLTWKGFKWHQKDSSVPVAGVPTRPLFYSPRFSLAYDLRGNGKTVFRGGWGAYHLHDSTFIVAGAQLPLGVQTWTEANVGNNGSTCTFAQLFTTGKYIPCGAYTTGTPATSPFDVSAQDPHDDRLPVTYNYNFTVDQSIPWKMKLEVGYVGNQSSSLSTLGNLQNQNVIPLGAFYGPDPVTGQVNSLNNIPNSGADYRPYPNYQKINVPTHKAWANYNGMQVSLNKQAGSLIFGLNYTMSKTLAVRGSWDTGAISDPVNMSHDYGITSFDRRHIFNANYSWQEGNKFHGNKILGVALNGWEVSGISSLQFGPDLAVLSGNNYGLQGTAGYYYTSNGQDVLQSFSVGNSQWLGTSDYTLQPIVTCNPNKGLGKNQFVNGNCFSLPPQGSQGQWNLPDSRGPKYFKWDMTVTKNFKINKRQDIQFRLAGFNFLNHPIISFSGQDANKPLSLVVGDPTGSHFTSIQDALNGAKVVNPNIFGGTSYKVGQRILELSLKYNF
jgi:hypothetical protein